MALHGMEEPMEEEPNRRIKIPYGEERGSDNLKFIIQSPSQLKYLICKSSVPAHPRFNASFVAHLHCNPWVFIWYFVLWIYATGLGKKDILAIYFFSCCSKLNFQQLKCKCSILWKHFATYCFALFCCIFRVRTVNFFRIFIAWKEGRMEGRHDSWFLGGCG